MAESEAAKLMGKVKAGGPLSLTQAEDAQGAVQAELQTEVTGQADEFVMSRHDKARFHLRDEETYGYVRDPEHPVWRRTEGDSRMRMVEREYPGARMLIDDNGERLHVGEDLVAVAIPKVLKEEKLAAQEEEKRAYIARNPILALESGMNPAEVSALLMKYRDPEYLEARDAEFNAEDRAAIRMRVEMQRAQSEMARRSRLSATQGMTYEEAERFYRRQIRRDIEGVSGRGASQRQVDEAYNSFVSEMEGRARQGPMDVQARDWKAEVARARARSMGSQFAIGATGLGESTQEKVRRRSKGA